MVFHDNKIVSFDVSLVRRDKEGYVAECYITTNPNGYGGGLIYVKELSELIPLLESYRLRGVIIKIDEGLGDIEQSKLEHLL